MSDTVWWNIKYWWSKVSQGRLMKHGVKREGKYWDKGWNLLWNIDRGQGMSMKHEMHSNSDIASLSTRAGQTLTREILCSVTKLTTLYLFLAMCTNIVFWSIWRGESRSFPQAKPIRVVATLVVTCWFSIPCSSCDKHHANLQPWNCAELPIVKRGLVTIDRSRELQ